MLTEICAELHNYFSQESDRFIGDFEIVDGSIVPSISIQDGQYYRIVQSVKNDGVHKYGDPNDILEDEPKFHGAVWLMRVPKDVVELSEKIAMWQNAYETADSPNMSPYQSESFGGYSYSKKASGSDSGNGSYTWKDAFATHLNRYRKIRTV